ncbi:MAG: Dihydrolipoyllysine-residue acetyltransferase component of pyruvate dehydrogenase complex [Gammaproteobacteria bacterium]|nr:MAG: Dihydrolipoyllysine-residue acetyltransferase component of pyruvate dehydrogenase complex [Gammaproteobacteria bacterium]
MTTIRVPDIGDASNVTVIEIAVSQGDTVSEGDTLIVLESDKASMEIPADVSGVVGKIHISEGSEVNEGDPICELDGPGSVAEAPKESVPAEPAVAEASGAPQLVSVPDTGSVDGVTVIEIAVAVGESVVEGDTLIVLESDKASMEIPAPAPGVVTALKVAEGQQVVQGDPICEMTADNLEDGSAATPQASSEPMAQAPAEKPVLQESAGVEQVVVPDTGNADGVTVIEVSIGVGDRVSEGDTIIVLESDKASMEIPSPVSGKVLAISVKEGDSVAQGDLIADVEATGGSTPQVTTTANITTAPAAVSAPAPAARSPEVEEISEASVGLSVHAGPAVRALARELGVNLSNVASTGPRGRITKDDLHNFVKSRLKEVDSGQTASVGSGIPLIPPSDFAAFGPVERIPMTKIHKLTADNMTRCWLNVPAVTQFDEADITDLEAFRKSMKTEAEKKGVRLTPLPFLIKAAAYALTELPRVNASIDPSTDEIVRKGYVHIGIAVDTPDGLMVPVVRDADQKGIWEIAAEVSELADKAKSKKLKPAEMQGATFTISSLGSIGGTSFTPIVPSPQAAILGISKASMQPVWDGTAFQPRLMLPLCLSYDHRVINGGDGARFTTLLGKVLGDIRHMVF